MVLSLLHRSPPEVQLLSNVKRVDLRFNQIRVAPNLADASGLKELYLGSNYLTTLGNCEFCPRSLQVLDVRDNKISTCGKSCRNKSATVAILLVESTASPV